MGFIKKIVMLQARRTRKIKALVDTGADYCYISSALAKYIGAVGYGRTMKYEVGDGRVIKSDIVMFTTVIDGKRFATEAVIIGKNEMEFVIGVKFLQKNSIRIMGKRLILPKFPELKIHRL